MYTNYCFPWISHAYFRTTKLHTTYSSQLYVTYNCDWIVKLSIVEPLWKEVEYPEIHKSGDLSYQPNVINRSSAKHMRMNSRTTNTSTQQLQIADSTITVTITKIARIQLTALSMLRYNPRAPKHSSCDRACPTALRSLLNHCVPCVESHQPNRVGVAVSSANTAHSQKQRARTSTRNYNT